MLPHRLCLLPTVAFLSAEWADSTCPNRAGLTRFCIWNLIYPILRMAQQQPRAQLIEGGIAAHTCK